MKVIRYFNSYSVHLYYTPIAFRNYIFEDIRGRFELACTWLTKEYLLSLAAHNQSAELNDENDGYSQCLAEILKGLTDKLDMEDKYVIRY